MGPFCANPKCQYHGFEAEEKQHRIFVEKDSVRQEIERHIHVDTDGNLFQLCSICNNAIKMIMPKRKEASGK